MPAWFSYNLNQYLIVKRLSCHCPKVRENGSKVHLHDSVTVNYTAPRIITVTQVTKTIIGRLSHDSENLLS